MELNREQIIKAFECCIRGVDADGTPPCDECPYDWCNIVGGEDVRQRTGSCQYWLKVDALALHRELTEENERLQAEIAHLEGHREADIKAFKALKADTVRKMQERLKKRIEKSSYNARTDRKTVRKEELLEQVNWVYHEVVPDLIDQIAREIMEENNG